MRKYFSATIVFLLSLALLLPFQASAVNDVTFSENTNIYLTGRNLTLVVLATSTVDSITVNPTNISVDLAAAGSAITIRSADLLTFSADPTTATTGSECEDTYSSITLTSTGAPLTDVVVFPTTSVCSAGDPNPPGGGAGPPPEPEPEPEPEPAPPISGTVGSGGGSVTTSGGEAEITIPENVVPDDTTVTITPSTDTTATPPPTGSFMVGSQIYNFTATSAEGDPITTFDQPVTLTFTYTDAQIAEIGESSLQVYYWDSSSSSWISVGGTVDPVTNTVTVDVDHFTYFTLIGEAPSVAVKRLSGTHRYQTAVQVSQEMYTTSSKAVIARGDNFPDALSASALADSLEGPVLLTESTTLSLSTRDELSRLGVTQVYLVGGTSAISSGVETALSNLGYTVSRISGTDRYDTAQKVADYVYDENIVSSVFITTGENFPDALSAASPARLNSAPLLFVKKDSVPTETTSYLAKLSNLSSINVIGGTSVVSSSVATSLEASYGTVSRISGANRYQTAIQIANHFFISPAKIIVSTGENFPDALVGGVLALSQSSPVILTQKTSLPSDVSTYLQTQTGVSAYVIGGTNAVSSSVKSSIESLLSS